MIDRNQYYVIVMHAYLSNVIYLNYKNGTWIRPCRTFGIMCNLAWYMLYEMGV